MPALSLAVVFTLPNRSRCGIRRKDELAHFVLEVLKAEAPDTYEDARNFGAALRVRSGASSASSMSAPITSEFLVVLSFLHLLSSSATGKGRNDEHYKHQHHQVRARIHLYSPFGGVDEKFH
jgi:hypothetical protein